MLVVPKFVEAGQGSPREHGVQHLDACKVAVCEDSLGLALDDWLRPRGIDLIRLVNLNLILTPFQDVNDDTKGAENFAPMTTKSRRGSLTIRPAAKTRGRRA